MTWKCWPPFHSARRAEEEGKTSQDHSPEQVTCFGGTVPLSLGRKSHRRGDSRGLPQCWGGYISLTHPNIPLSLCQHVILHQPGMNPVSSACSTAAPSCCCSSSWLYCIERFGATVPFTWAWGGIREAKKLQRCTQQSPRKPNGFKARCAGSASVPVSGGFQFPSQCDPGSQLCHQPRDLCAWQRGQGWIPAAGLDSRWSATCPYLYTIQPLPAIKLILYVQACFSN